MRLDAVRTLLAQQDRVVARRQLRDAGITQAHIDTLLRRRELVVVHPGVYLTHTGTPTWSQRSWAAILYAGRSALHVESALHHPSQGPPPSGPIHVAVDRSRRVAPRHGIVVHRVRGLDDLVRWNLSPPRVRLEVAAVEAAHLAADELAAISALASAAGCVGVRCSPPWSTTSRTGRTACSSTATPTGCCVRTGCPSPRRSRWW
ncbi:type IV toxin-antitoxin system AbiEi family antitoxin domain-containing protein [Nocardioides alpinus]|uniref:Transcriptional regulator, AbiEi antitoxin, Type IV TA system n=1 Tax=Nocardioides alpinus TaxID=748909 RepID=A0ABX4QSU4_9ACTN|nr:type IV toxin-antitoxin system AbiEi family antitoxin domain-containing protein [Nocardioides alpinus]PKH37708.1 hypothetical protein CXG46_20015 [Nocardioides alpinus]